MRAYRRLWLILILSVLTIFGLVRLGNIDISLDTLAHVNGGWFLLALLSFYVSVVARGWRWQRILKTMGWQVNFYYAVTLLTAGLFTSSILPARAGDIGRVAMLKQDYKVPASQGIASLAAERALDVFSILSLAILGAWWALPGRLPPEVLQFMAMMGILLLAGLIGLFIIPSTESWLRESRLILALIPARFQTLYQKALGFGFSLVHGVRLLGHKPVALTVITIESFLIWLYDAITVHVILISIGAAVPFSASLFTTMISDLSTALPLTPGALGQFDATMIGILAIFGLSTTAGSLATLLVRVITLWSFIPISGLITYLFGFSRILNINRTTLQPEQGPLLSTTPTSNPAEG